MFPPFILHEPAEQTSPLVFTSSHSGRHYPADFLAAARLDPLTLRRSEDGFVDELFAAAPAAGAPLLTATFARAFCDANREAWELDPDMFDGALPPWVNTSSTRVHAGLGTIARVVSSGEGIYRQKLSFGEAERRVREFWQPWHTQLAALVAQTTARFGVCWLIDCHSMPSCDTGAPGRTAAQFVLGDAHGTSCAQPMVALVERILRRQGFRVARNDPYAGGYITRRYGRPAGGVHALQIEIARDLYMDERRVEKGRGFEQLRNDLAELIGSLVEHAPALLRSS